MKKVSWWQRYHRLMAPLQTMAWVIGLICLYTWSLQGLKINLEVIKTSLPYMVDFGSRLFPPDLSIIDVAIAALIETVQMSIWGTTIGALISIPIALLSVRHLSPWWLVSFANLLQNAVRSVPSIILGLIFVAATGLGALAGTLALGIYTIGYLGKFYQGAIEAIDQRPITALEVTGASWWQIAQYGILPQVLPSVWGYTLWMFEYNIRAASVLGVVGAGGIGFALVNYIKNFEYAKAMTIILVIFVVATAIDFFSSQLRHRLDRS